MKLDLTATNRVNSYGFPAFHIPLEVTLEEDQHITCEFLKQLKADSIVVDSYEVDSDYLLGLRKAGTLVISIDDLAKISFPSHIVINGSIYAPELSYHSLTGDTRFLLGTKYMLLREEFWDIPKRIIRKEVDNILVTLGGADSHNLTPLILGLLNDVYADFSITIIIGPLYENQKEIEEKAKQLNKQVDIIYSPTSMKNIMFESDLVISSGGQTLYELAATGTPTVALQTADNQEGNVRYMSKDGIIKGVRFINNPNWQRQLLGEITHLLNSYEERKRMCDVGQKLVDGKGTLRVVETLQKGLKCHKKY